MVLNSNFGLEIKPKIASSVGKTVMVFASSSRMASYNNAGGIVDAEDFTTFAHGDLA